MCYFLHLNGYTCHPLIIGSGTDLLNNDSCSGIDFSGFSIGDLKDKEPLLSLPAKNTYDLYISDKTDCLTIKYYNDCDFQSISTLLKDLYPTFQRNQDNTGIIAETTLADKSDNDSICHKNIVDTKCRLQAFVFKDLLKVDRQCNIKYMHKYPIRGKFLIFRTV